MVLIFTTIHKKSDAVKIGKNLLKQRLIACYNLFPVDSAYWWFTLSKSQHEPSTNSSKKVNAKIGIGKGKIIEEKETLIIFKTKDANFKKIETFIKKHSGYETPEVIAIKPADVNSDYLKWIETETK